MRPRGIVVIVLSASLLLGLIVGFVFPRSSGDAEAVSAETTQSAPAEESTQDATGPSEQGTPADVSQDEKTRLGYNQPNVTVPVKLAAGEKPPQFVVLSFDGACKDELYQHYRDLAKRNDGHFTFFLSGLCLLPDAEAKNYDPPKKPAGSSAIGFADPTLVQQRIENLRTIWNDGMEIGTHFLGHFCDAQGVGVWSAADWQSEINQFNEFVFDWQKYNPDVTGVEPLPFDSSVIKGDRTPCLAGKRDQMYPVFVKEGFLYDASNSGSLAWPKKMSNGLWNFPLQTVKIAGYNHSNLSMDYNFLYVQNKAKVDAPQATCDKIEQSTYQSLMDALDAVYNGNRAPLFIGNHFNDWVCGAYVKALTRFVDDAHKKYPDVDFVSFMDLVRWLEAQDKSTVKRLQRQGTQTY